MDRRQFVFVAGALSGCALYASTTKSFPTRNMSLIVPFPAGSATDTVTRVIAQPLSTALGQNIVVENRPGADGAIAVQSVIRSPADGHTLLLATATAITGVPALRKNPPYNPTTDLTPITQIANFPFLLVVNAELPIKTLDEFVRYAKANPGKLSFASGNMTGIIAMSQLSQKFGLDLLHIPYKGEPPAILDVGAGRVSMMFATPTTSDAFLRSGMVRALVTTHQTRLSMYPDVPAISEAGSAGLSFAPWGGLFGPAGLSAAVVQRLSQEVARVMATPDVIANLQKHQVEIRNSTPSDFAAFLEHELAEWRRIAIARQMQQD